MFLCCLFLAVYFHRKRDGGSMRFFMVINFKLPEYGSIEILMFAFKLLRKNLVNAITLIKSPPTMWWWRFFVFAESARRSHLFLLSLENPYSNYFQIFAICILALGNLPGNFFCVFQFLTKSKMAANILWRTLELEPLHRIVSCLV